MYVAFNGCLTKQVLCSIPASSRCIPGVQPLIAPGVSTKSKRLISPRTCKRSVSAISVVQEAATETAQTQASAPFSQSGTMSAAEGCLRFINYAWTQFHAVGTSLDPPVGPAGMSCILASCTHSTSKVWLGLLAKKPFVYLLCVSKPCIVNCRGS